MGKGEAGASGESLIREFLNCFIDICPDADNKVDPAFSVPWQGAINLKHNRPQRPKPHPENVQSVATAL